MGWDAHDVDIVNPDSDRPMDLSADSTWIHYTDCLQSYDAVFFGTECKTFSRLRAHANGLS